MLCMRPERNPNDGVHWKWGVWGEIHLPFPLLPPLVFTGVPA